MCDMKAKVLLENGETKYRSKLERRWALECSEVLLAETGLRIHSTLYEPLRFYLDGGSYLPDFVHILANGGMTVVECKSSKHARGYRASRVKLKQASAKFGFLDWLEVRPRIKGGGWEIDRL